MEAIARLMDAAEYDAWYRTPRGQWIGETEFRLLSHMLQAKPGESLLDIGCGTAYFTRRFAQENGGAVIGLDPNLAWLRFARAHPAGSERFVAGAGGKLPFSDRAFDRTVSVAALCFAQDQPAFLSEMVRVTRRRFALGLLNRASLLYWQKGRQGGTGAYRGAHWHTANEIRALLERLPVNNVAVRSGVFLPAGGSLGRWMERALPGCLPIGSF
ncbi:MAG: methyltransferase domain-containing protein, partial [Sulfuricellaceae bacterium]|nr:methyltransferase domain-containing protein [Sulfuricellaceae bacterium]